MARVVELVILINGVCGIAAFLTARGLIRRTRRKIGLGEDE